MKKISIIIIAMAFSIMSFGQIEGYLYDNGVRIDSSVTKFIVVFVADNGSRKPAMIDLGSGEKTAKHHITDFKGTTLKFGSLMELMNLIESNGFELESKDYGLTLIEVYRLFYVRKEN